MLKNLLIRLLTRLSSSKKGDPLHLPKINKREGIKLESVNKAKEVSKTQREIAMEVIAEKAREVQADQKRGFFYKLSSGLVTFANYLSVLMTFIRSFSILRASSLIVKGLWFLVSVLLLNGVFNYVVIPFDFLDTFFNTLQEYYTLVKGF
jgi:hypothetical protein